MEPLSVTGDRSDVPPFESLLFNEEFQRLIAPQAAPAGNASSFAAILELGPTQAMELLHWPEHPDSRPYVHSVDDGDVLFAPPPGSANTGYGARCVAYAGKNSSTPSSQEVKQEAAACSASKSNSWTHPVVSDTALESKGPSSTKRKEREQKGKGSAKKKKKKNEISQDAQALPYVHVRARRGQATDSHSLAERARREKINARMKLLQELVPGCNKISGTALVLDEIINHVQSLQRQVELLSMKLAAVNPHIDFNLDSIFAPEDVSLLDGNSPVPMVWPGIQFSGSREHYQQQRHFPSFQHSVWGKEEGSSFAMPEASRSTSNCSANAVPLGSHQPRMEM